MIKNIFLIVIGYFIISCSSDDDTSTTEKLVSFYSVININVPSLRNQFILFYFMPISIIVQLINEFLDCPTMAITHKANPKK
jgi:hypothetical protein